MNEIEAIADAAIDIPEVDYVENINTITKSIDISTLPTGSLIVSRGANPIIMYHSNDTHCHCSILLWCSYDGKDRISLHYEPGKTRPLFFELDVAPTSFSRSSCVQLNEIDLYRREQEFAHKPLHHLTSHPRYLSSFSELIQTLPGSFYNNDNTAISKYKWQPVIFGRPMDNGFSSAREYYYELASKTDSRVAAFRSVRKVSYACVDVVMLFLSLLHESLYINLTEDEVSRGLIPESKRIFIDNEDYDVARLLSDQSDVYKMYDRQSSLMLKSIRAGVQILILPDFAFFAPIILALIIGSIAMLFMKPVIFLFFGRAVGIELRDVIA